jgi:hypothetical protein
MQERVAPLYDSYSTKVAVPRGDDNALSQLFDGEYSKNGIDFFLNI